MKQQRDDCRDQNASESIAEQTPRRQLQRRLAGMCHEDQVAALRPERPFLPNAGAVQCLRVESKTEPPESSTVQKRSKATGKADTPDEKKKRSTRRRRSKGKRAPVKTPTHTTTDRPLKSPSEEGPRSAAEIAGSVGQIGEPAGQITGLVGSITDEEDEASPGQITSAVGSMEQRTTLEKIPPSAAETNGAVGQIVEPAGQITGLVGSITDGEDGASPGQITSAAGLMGGGGRITGPADERPDDGETSSTGLASSPSSPLTKKG